MAGSPSHTDILVLGAGVAGITAALCAAKSGLGVMVLERGAAPPNRPGETLHPGIAPIFETLGVLDEVEQVSLSRPLGIIHRTDGTSNTNPYGETEGENWRGFHILRQDLQRILKNHASALGAQFMFGQGASTLLEQESEAIGLVTPNGELSCRWLIDATGLAGWTARKKQIDYRQASPRFSVCYGYSKTGPDDPVSEWPVFEEQTGGWSFQATIGNGTTAWLEATAKTARIKELIARGARVHDGTWKVATVPAQNGIFRVGDCAARIDPSSGKGVMRAVMSAMMATHLINATSQAKIELRQAEKIYSDWLCDWFNADVQALRSIK